MGVCERGTKKYPDGRTGTVAGFMAHKQAGEAQCDSCRKAWNENVLRLRALDPEKRKRRRMITELGMTERHYDHLVQSQDGRCAVCGRVPERLVIDHDHACCLDGHKRCGDCNRSLLCDHCNRGLGHFRDNPELLDAAAKYLREWGK